MFFYLQINGWLEKLRTEVGIDEAPENIEATQRSVEQWETQRETVIALFLSNVSEGQRLLQDLR